MDVLICFSNGCPYLLFLICFLLLHFYSFNLWLSWFILLDKQSLSTELLDPTHPELGSRLDNMPDIAAYNSNRWSLENAIYLSNLLPNDLDEDQKAALQEFLSMYALTQSDAITGNGTWEDIQLVNGDAARSALFGSGTSVGGLISATHIGGLIQYDQTTYQDMREILDRLGIQATKQKDHEHHFHIYLNPPEPEPLNRSVNLLAENQASEVFGGEQSSLGGAQMVVDYANAIMLGEELMVSIDIPYIPPQQETIELAQAEADIRPADYLVKSCNPVNSDAKWGGGEIDPITSLLSVVKEAITIDSQYFSKRPSSLRGEVTLLGQVTQFKHGKLESYTHPDDGTPYFFYKPESGYIGKDYGIFMARFDGKYYKIIIEVSMHPDYDESHKYPDSLCPWPLDELIKIDKSSSGGRSLNFDWSAVSVDFADLPGGALGKTVGTSITLDSNAAGHGWYIDGTPWDNDSFLPTADPQEWIAKSGGEADGKMDLLSVLLHEFSHAFGVGHSADVHDSMAAPLQPGIRRLPSPELLAELQGYAVETAGNPDDPSPLPNPIPFAGFSAFWVGRLRKSGYGYLLESVGVNNDRDIQYAVTPNPTLLNPEFAAVDGWNLTGNVALAGNAAVLRESATTQTRLNQIFTLNAGDRFLRFTLDGINLDDVNGAPDDAFEVALIDANTNQSLLSANGLTRSDAAINLQADGSEHLASEVTSTLNADGSRTYLLDLSGIAADTAVSLSFDLIGFGRNNAATNSQVTVRDLRLGIPETYDDAVTTAEDIALTIDALANDLDADQPGFAPVIVTGPAHGQVVINTDGSFDYTPDQDWSGEDSFSYLLSDGNADSNTATVTVTVTPVNDAPLASDAQLTTLEDEALTIDLASYGSDIDSASLTAQVVTGPANGVITQNQDGTFSFAPNANFHGVDSFTYLISDGDLNSATAVVTIDVSSVNDAPSGADNTVTTLEKLKDRVALLLYLKQA